MLLAYQCSQLASQGENPLLTILSNEAARNILQAARVARLGCIVEGGPYIVPINYNFEHDYVYSHSLPGLKIEALRKNPRACVQVDEVESDLCWRSVLAFGNFEEVWHQTERKELLDKLLTRFPLLTPVESAIAADGGALEVVVYRIRIDRLTGVSEG
jgi:nitroimidazol reductase NimA-like FMN-containing flavoprotein (pyridoxamine 5'-phosphate oxidase superfamily)